MLQNRKSCNFLYLHLLQTILERTVPSCFGTARVTDLLVSSSRALVALAVMTYQSAV
jgi:hypothetical protein